MCTVFTDRGNLEYNATFLPLHTIDIEDVDIHPTEISRVKATGKSTPTIS